MNRCAWTTICLWLTGFTVAHDLNDSLLWLAPPPTVSLFPDLPKFHRRSDLRRTKSSPSLLSSAKQSKSMPPPPAKEPQQQKTSTSGSLKKAKSSPTRLETAAFKSNSNRAGALVLGPATASKLDAGGQKINLRVYPDKTKVISSMYAGGAAVDVQTRGWKAHERINHESTQLSRQSGPSKGFAGQLSPAQVYSQGKVAGVSVTSPPDGMGRIMLQNSDGVRKTLVRPNTTKTEFVTSTGEADARAFANVDQGGTLSSWSFVHPDDRKPKTPL